MSWHMAVGFVLGVAISTSLVFMSMEIKAREIRDDEDCILHLLESKIADDKLIEELLEENKAYKRAWDSFNEERNSDYWG